ncbi:MAG: N-acetylmuramoyl-L-alanine amidase [Lewinellaceae bacterium]|nr:N-acetylmuramoyl-L-alanine amidase [Lewinellaceae bacterium]
MHGPEWCLSTTGIGLAEESGRVGEWETLGPLPSPFLPASPSPTLPLSPRLPLCSNPSVSSIAPYPAAKVSFGAETDKVIKERINQKNDYRIKTVVIDPGHGGHDPGCLGGSSQEKHLALAVSQALARAMQARYPGIRVILTRNEDVFIPLHERAAIANHNEADLFISIHCNFMPGSGATHGTETYVMGLHTAEHNLEVAKRENAAILLEDDYQRNYDYDPNSPEGHIMLSMFQNAYLEQSILFAERVEAKFRQQAMLKSRGVKQAGFVVLKETAMPSVLVETGFLSNKEEEEFLMAESGQQSVAAAILSAFEEYKAIVEGGEYPEIAMAKNTSANPSYSYATPERTVSYQPATPSTAPPPAMQPRTYGQPSGEVDSPERSNNQPKVIPLKYEYGTVSEKGTSRPAAVPASSGASIQFNVQLAAASRPLDTSDSKWRNTGYLVEVVSEDNLFKYQARNFSTLQQAFEARLLLQARGFPDAFIVAYKDGQRISVEEAKRELGIP